MKTTTILALSIASLALAAPAAHAQPAGEEVELGDEPLADEDDGSPGGASENPDAPKTLIDDPDPGDEGPKPKAAGDGPYPIKLSARPLTLHSGMSQVSIGAGAVFDPVTLFGSIRGDYGVNREIQIGLAYSPGALIDGTFETGKAVGVEGRYLIFDWLSAQLAVPVLLDPFGIAVVAGAPVKFRFDKFAVFAGEDALAVKIYRLIPSVENAALTAAQVAADATNTELPDAEFRAIGGVIYQIEDDLAFTARAGLGFLIGASDAANPRRFLSNLRITWTKGRRVDLGAEINVGDFNQFTESAGVGVFANLRI